MVYLKFQIMRIKDEAGFGLSIMCLVILAPAAALTNRGWQAWVGTILVVIFCVSLAASCIRVKQPKQKRKQSSKFSK